MENFVLRTPLSFALLALTATTATAAVQDDEAANLTTRADVIRTTDANFQRLDANGNGAVSKEEITAAQQKVQETAASATRQIEERFKVLDTDKNGSVSLAEFKSIVPNPRMVPVDTTLARFDGNKDGTITTDEFRAPILANFDRIDANKDGTLSAEERSQALAARRAAQPSR